MDKFAEEENQRDALRRELDEKKGELARSRAFVWQLWGAAVALTLSTVGLGIALLSHSCPKAPDCQPATVIGTLGSAHVAPGTPTGETRSDLFPLVVSTKDHARCFSLLWDGKVERAEECGYTIDYAQLRKALCQPHGDALWDGGGTR